MTLSAIFMLLFFASGPLLTIVLTALIVRDFKINGFGSL